MLGAELALDSGESEGALATFERIVREFGDSASAPRAGLQAAALRLERQDPARALAILAAARTAIEKDPVCRPLLAEIETEAHLEAAAQALDRQAEDAKDDGPRLNDVAWTAFERRLRLPEAVGWARRAVELTERKDAAVLDTLANLLFAAGEVEEAVRVEEEAVQKAPEEMRAELEEVLVRLRAVLAHRTARNATAPSAPPADPGSPAPPPRSPGEAPKEPGERSCGR
jgi:tetratricopeptide (TPR) repeat protein